MILLRYTKVHDSELQKIDDEYPFTFLKSYHQWEQTSGNDTGIILEEENGTFIPVKFYQRMFFLFAQFLHYPIKQRQRLSVYEENIFLTRAVNFLKRDLHVQRILHSPPMVNFQASPENSEHCPFGTYFINLLQSENDMFQKIQPRTRRYIQKAIEDKGVEIKMGADCLSDFYTLHAVTMKREVAYYESFEKIQQFVKSLSPKNMLCLVAYRNHLPEAGLLIPYSLHSGILYYGGEAHNSTAAITNKWLHWEAMRELKKRKVKKLILGGSRIGNLAGTKFQGIQGFKERLGAEVETGLLWKMDLHPVYTNFYDALTTMRNLLSGKKPHPDIIDFYHQRNRNS